MDGLCGHLNDENGGAIHHHHLTGVLNADRHRLGRSINGAAGDGRADGKTGLSGGLGCHMARNLGGPHQARQFLQR